MRKWELRFIKSNRLNPWRVASYAPNEPQIFGSFFYEEEAQAECDRLNADEEQKAAARLIAAIPDLFAATRKIVIAAIRSKSGKRLNVAALLAELHAAVAKTTSFT